MLTLTIDGVEVQVSDGTNLIEAAKKAGKEVPTYCYHPGLTVVGQCRICFVEVEGMPRLVTACSTMANDGMVVHTASERVAEARAAVMEFLLANHPLDCPVCDQAGECGLQDYSVEHGLDTTHMVENRRVFPGFENRRIGPRVVQNQNRCIHCTRCVRFTEEISETNDLVMKDRGNHAHIDTFDGRPFDNPWSACVADVCPVGALTTEDFRFRARVWHLEETPSVCPGCSIGCNISIGLLDGEVHRFTPRENCEINGWWMCDHGRSLATSLNDRDLAAPMTRRENAMAPVSWDEALDRLAEVISSERPRVVASANLSNEVLYLVHKVLVSQAGLEVVVPIEHGVDRAIKNGRGEWIQNRDCHPNSTGARCIGLKTVDGEGLADFVAQGKVLVLDPFAHTSLEENEIAAGLDGRLVSVMGSRQTSLSKVAELQLPTANWVEAEGTLTSSTGRVQLAARARGPRGLGRPAWKVLVDLGTRLGAPLTHLDGARAIFEDMAAEIPAFAGMAYRRLATEPGIPVLEEVSHVG